MINEHSVEKVSKSLLSLRNTELQNLIQSDSWWMFCPEVQTVSAYNVDYSCISKRLIVFPKLLCTTINDNEIRFDTHGAVRRRLLSRNTNKMQLCNRIYYSKVFLKAQHVSSGTPLIIRSSKLCLQPLVYMLNEYQIFKRQTGHIYIYIYIHAYTAYKPEAANTV